MAEPVRLHDLMSAVANAVLDAQDKVERHQIESFRHFFDPKGRPVSVKVALPWPGPTPQPKTEAKPTSKGSEADSALAPTKELSPSKENVGPAKEDREAALDAEAQILSVPLLALVPTNLLQIKEFNVSFEVELGELDFSEPSRAEHAQTHPIAAGAPLGVPQITGAAADEGSRLFEPFQPSPSLTVGLQTSTTAARGAMARVTLKLEAQPQPEGLSRLIQHLNRTF